MTRRVTTAALAAMLLAAAPAQAAKKADLTIAKAATPASSLATGGTLTVTWTVKSAGGNAAKSTTAVVLSADGRYDKTDVTLGTFTQKAIKGSKTGAGSLTAK